MKQIDRRRKAITNAITAESKLQRNQYKLLNNKHRNNQHQSNSSGGSTANTDSLLDKWRAVTGTDSTTLLSRTILGAYPGDAVPLSEAANPRGVAELAQKYGYGDWSGDDDDDDLNDGNNIKVKSPTKENKRLRSKKKPRVLKQSKGKNDSWINRHTKQSSQSVSFSLSLSNNDRLRKQPPRSSRRMNDLNEDSLRNDRTTTTAGTTNAAVPSSSQPSMILQRHNHPPQQQRHQLFPTKSTTKVRAATELLAEKRRQLSANTEE